MLEVYLIAVWSDVCTIWLTLFRTFVRKNMFLHWIVYPAIGKYAKLVFLRFVFPLSFYWHRGKCRLLLAMPMYWNRFVPSPLFEWTVRIPTILLYNDARAQVDLISLIFSFFCLCKTSNRISLGCVTCVLNPEQLDAIAFFSLYPQCK